jgi:uncharacterized heparinase superfamily protein
MLAWLGPSLERGHRRHRGRPGGWPASFRPIAAKLGAGMPCPEDNADGRFEFLNLQLALGRPVDWNPTEADKLWRFHLHYFEWAWGFAAHADNSWARATFRDLWQSWETSAPLGKGDAWAPYVVALRSWVLCGVFDRLVAGGPDEQDVLDQIERHAWFVRHHLERDVGGNHLVKNLKALIGLGVFLGDHGLTESGGRELNRQVRIQILGDGGHYERSPSYHCQVLEDLLDVNALLCDAGLPEGRELAETIERMRAWLGTMLLPDGDVPLFNDCALVGLDRLALLEPGFASPNRVVTLADSGYIVIRPRRGLHLVIDVGIACPPNLPAHAHADCLSFELACAGARVVVDSGTSTYAAGPIRDYERSTSAHNTVELDDQSQVEVWGAFRVARRGRPTIEWVKDDGVGIDVRASHDGYRRLPGRPIHHRRFQISDDSVVITDDIEGTGRHRCVARLHLAPDTPVSVASSGSWQAGPLALIFTPAAAGVTNRPVASAFNARQMGPCFEVSVEGALPHRVITTVQVAHDSAIERPPRGGAAQV